MSIPTETPRLEDRYRRDVAGALVAAVLAKRDFASFADAMLRKLVPGWPPRPRSASLPGQPSQLHKHRPSFANRTLARSFPWCHARASRHPGVARAPKFRLNSAANDRFLVNPTIRWRGA